jgi:hypothetical protein
MCTFWEIGVPAGVFYWVKFPEEKVGGFYKTDVKIYRNSH